MLLPRLLLGDSKIMWDLNSVFKLFQFKCNFVTYIYLLRETPPRKIVSLSATCGWSDIHSFIKVQIQSLLLISPKKKKAIRFHFLYVSKLIKSWYLLYAKRDKCQAFFK